VTDEGVRWLVNLPALTALDLSGSVVTDRGVEMLSGCSAECGACPALTTLKLRYCERVTNGAMWALRNLTTLTDLDIGFTSVTDEGLRALANMPALTSLCIMECDMTDEGVAALPARVRLYYDE
jgi:internalin A